MLGVLVLTCQEHLIPGHQHLIKMAYRNTLTILRAELSIGLTRPARGSRDNREALRIDRDRTTYCEISIFLSHRSARHHQQFVHIRTTGHDRLGPRDDNTLSAPLRDMHVAVNILLIARALAAIPFAIGHGDSKGQVLVLNPMQVGKKTFVVLPGSILRHLPSRLINGIERIVGQIALSTATLSAQQPHRFELGQQVLAVTVNVQHSIHSLTRGSLVSQHQSTVLGLLGKIVGHADRTDTGLQSGLIDH